MSKRVLRKQRKAPLGTFFPKGTLRSANGAIERTVDFDIIKKEAASLSICLTGQPFLAGSLSICLTRQPFLAGSPAVSLCLRLSRQR